MLLGQTCTTPSITACGTGGGSCTSCDPTMASACVSGVCQCGGSPSCAGCDAGTCPVDAGRRWTPARQKRVMNDIDAPPGVGATAAVVDGDLGQPSQVMTAPPARTMAPVTYRAVAAVAALLPES